MAGLAFGFATSLRVFPLAFLLAACLPFVIDLIHNFRQTFRKPAALLAGAITVIIPLLLLSLVLYPWSNWLDFAEKINGHNKTFFVMHLGYDKLAASTITSAPQFFFNNTSNFENWNIYLNDRINEHWQFHRCVALLFFAGAIFAGLKADIKMSCLLVGETILFFFALPANYYYIYLATFGAVAVVALQQQNTLGTRSRFWGLILFLVVCNMVAGFSNDWIKLNWGINLGLFILLALYVFSQAIEQCTTKFRLRLLLTMVSVVIVGLFTFNPRNLVSTNSNGLKTQVLMFTPTDVKQGKAWYQDLHATEPFWPTKEQVLIQCVSNKIVVSKTFVVPIAHYYKISLYYATAPDYVKHLLIRCAGQFGEMVSWSPNVNITQASFGLTLPAGTNTITILADGSPKNELLGINSLIIKPSL